MTVSSNPPVTACALPPAALEDRINAWRILASEALSRDTESGRILSTYRNDPETAGRLDQLIDGERACCSFLEFSRQEQDGIIIVELRYPEHFGPMLDRYLTLRDR